VYESGRPEDGSVDATLESEPELLTLIAGPQSAATLIERDRAKDAVALLEN